MQRFRTFFGITLASTLLFACGGGSGSSAGSGDGTLSISLTDGPADQALEVHVIVTGLTLKREGVDPVDIVFPSPWT